MGLLDLLVLLLIAGICGAIAEAVVGFSPGGFLVSVVVGLLGAFIGSWLARQVGLPSVLALSPGGFTIDIIWSILGAVVLLLVLSLARGTRRRRALI